LQHAIKPKIRRAFDRSAGHYDRHAAFQKDTAGELADHIRAQGLRGGVVVDIGCGSGGLSARLVEAGAFGRVVALDISMGMCRLAHGRGAAHAAAFVIQADAEYLPLREKSVDLAVSNLALQWAPRPELVMRRVAWALKPGGRFIAATLGPATFHELREALRAALNGRGGLRVDDVFHRFVPAGTLARMAREAGFEVEVGSSMRVRHYESFTALMKGLKKVGAQNGPGLAALGLGRRGLMRRLAVEYDTTFAGDGGVRATYELVRIDARRAG